MNLVLLKNVSVVGLHWGAYRSMSPFPSRSELNSDTVDLVHEPERIPLVWRELFAYSSYPCPTLAVG